MSESAPAGPVEAKRLSLEKQSIETDCLTQVRVRVGWSIQLPLARSLRAQSVSHSDPGCAIPEAPDGSPLMIVGCGTGAGQMGLATVAVLPGPNRAG